MIKAQPISGFYENLPELQIIEDKFKDIIRKNYNLSGFVSLDTPAVERLEILTSKGADDSEIYALHRIHAENLSDVSMGLRFDLTVPLARYIGQYEGELTFPFKRQQIGRVYRGERPQKGRYREFYQADVDIIGNGKLALFADVEILSTIYSSLKELDFGDFVIHVNNKKFLSGFLLSIGIGEDKLVETISIIDKKEKIKGDKLQIMFTDIGINKEQIDKINEFVDLGKQKTIDEITSDFSDINNELLQEGIKELSYVYKNLLLLGIDEKFLKINPAISRGLNYYTGTVFETFIGGAEGMGSIASGGRYENLASNFTKNNFPGVGGSIGLSRLLSVLAELDKIRPETKTVSQVLIVNMGDEFLTNNLQIVKNLRKMLISTELYLDPEAKIQKQLKYANNKGIPFIIIAGEEEINNGIIQIKNLKTGEQYEIKMEKLNYNLFF